jgi:NitT/TauT family transport system substrate-binding protein
MNRTRIASLGLTLVCLAVLLTACGGGSDAKASPSIKLGLVQAQDFIHAMPARVATQQGFFEDEGLKVSVVDFSAGSDLTKAMAGGSVDVGVATGLDVTSASAHSIDLQAFYGVYGKSPMALIVPTDSSITGFKDLSGKKVGISKAGSLTDFVARAALKKVGVSASKVTEVPLGDPASTMTAMNRGDIDAFVLPANFGYIESAQGKGKIAQMATDVLGSDDQFSLLMAKKDYIGANKSNLKKLASAYTKSITWMKANKDKTISLAESKLGMNTAIATKTYDTFIDGFSTDGSLSRAGLANYADALPDLGIATTSPKESAYLSTAIVAAK